MMNDRRSLFILILFLISLVGSSPGGAQEFDYRKAAGKIDEFVLAHLKSEKLEPNPVITVTAVTGNGVTGSGDIP